MGGSLLSSRVITARHQTGTEAQLAIKITKDDRKGRQMWLEAVGNQNATTCVCVDSFQDSILSGRIYNPNFDEEIRFYSLIQFIFYMENISNQMEYDRCFANEEDLVRSKRERVTKKLQVGQGQGRLATFSLGTLLCQNAAWGGNVYWVEGKSEKKFSDFFELVLLMDKVLLRQNEGCKFLRSNY